MATIFGQNAQAQPAILQSDDDLARSASRPAKPDTLPKPPPTSPKSGLFRVLLRTVPVILILIAMGLAIFLFVYTSRTAWHGLIITTTKPLGDVLLLTTAASKLVFTAVPLLMTAAAYPIADAWVKRRKEFQEQASEYANENLPQIPDRAALSEMFTAANISAALKGSLFLFRRPEDKETESEKPKPQQDKKKKQDALSYGTLKQTVYTLIALLVLAYLIFLVDLILHGTSKALNVNDHDQWSSSSTFTNTTGNASSSNSATVDGSSSISAQYTLSLKGECDSLNSTTQRPCTIDFVEGGVPGSTYIEAAYIKGYADALDIISGTSSTFKVASLAYNGTGSEGERHVAALLPPNSGADYKMDTVGVYAQCTSMTQTCDFTTQCGAANATTVECGQCNLQGYPNIRAFTTDTQPHGVLKRYVTGSNAWDFEMNGSNGTDTNSMVFLFSAAFDTGSAAAELKGKGGLYKDRTWGRGVNTTLDSTVLVCYTHVVDLSVQYTTGAGYEIMQLQEAQKNGTIRAVTSVIDMYQSPFDYFFSTLEPLASASLASSEPEDFVSSFERLFAKTYLPFAQYAFTSSSGSTGTGGASSNTDADNANGFGILSTTTTITTSGSSDNIVMGTQVSVAWFLIYLLLLLAFVCVGIYIAIRSVVIHLQARWTEAKEDHEKRERENEKAKAAGDDEEEEHVDEDTRDTAECFTDPLGMTLNTPQAQEKQAAEERNGKGSGSDAQDVDMRDSVESLKLAIPTLDTLGLPQLPRDQAELQAQLDKEMQAHDQTPERTEAARR